MDISHAQKCLSYLVNIQYDHPLKPLFVSAASAVVAELRLSDHGLQNVVLIGSYDCSWQVNESQAIHHEYSLRFVQEPYPRLPDIARCCFCGTKILGMSIVVEML